MKPPKHLPPAAKAFWRVYHPLLKDRLHPLDMANFELMAVNWHVVRSVDPVADTKQGLMFAGAQKQFYMLSKAFGMTPGDRVKLAAKMPDTSDLDAELKGVMGGD